MAIRISETFQQAPPRVEKQIEDLFRELGASHDLVLFLRSANQRCLELEQQVARLREANERYRRSLQIIRNEIGNHGI